MEKPDTALNPHSRIKASPLSKLTIPEYIGQQINAGHLDKVVQEFPDHPLHVEKAVGRQH
jgi:hypothetical protein